MTQPTTTALSPDEWKTLCMVNVTQLHSFLQNIPPMMETGVAGLTDEHLALIDGHLNRQRAFLNAWRRARAAGTVAEPVPQQEQPTPTRHPPVMLEQQASGEPAQNGHDTAPKKKRGGWPKGKKRNATRVDAGAAQ